MTEQLARKAVEDEGEASALVALIGTGDVDAALALNGRVAAVMPHLRPVEVWFVRKIADRWGKVIEAQASSAWEAARAGADPALEARTKEAWFETWQWWQGERRRAKEEAEAKVAARAKEIAKQLEPKPEPSEAAVAEVLKELEEPEPKVEAKPKPGDIPPARDPAPTTHQ